MLALQCARVFTYLKDFTRAVQFAEYGLTLVDGILGSALTPLFKRIMAGDDFFCYTETEQFKKKKQEEIMKVFEG